MDSDWKPDKEDSAGTSRSPFENMADQPVQLLVNEFKEFKELLYKVNPSNIFIPELTRLSICISFASTALTVIDKGTDGTSVVTSIMAGDFTTGLLTLFFMYLSGIATIFIWVTAPGRVMDICTRLPETWKAIRYRLCCFCCGGRKGRKLYNRGCITCHKPFFWSVVVCCVVLSPISTPILFIIYFVRQVKLYRKCENVEDIKDEETISYRVITEVVSQAMIAECFFESAPQALLQMYVLATQFGRIIDSQQRLRFSITIVVMISSMLELGLTVGGRWVDNLVAHPIMELRPDFMKFLLYTEAISFLLVRSTLICGTILVLRALLHSGLLATLIVLAFLLIPRIIAMIVRILTRISNVRGEGMGDYIGQLVSRVAATLLFYPVLQYQWTLIYMECETVFLGLSCIFAYYGEYGVKAEIELFYGVKKGIGRGLIYGICLLYILNIALRWTRVIYLLRLKNTIPEDTVFTVYKYCQSITKTLDDFETKREETEAKKFKLRQLNCELGNLVKYFENNFGEILIEAGQQQLCLCEYSKYLNRLFLNEIQRRGNSIAEFRPAENQGVCQLGDTLLYAEMIDLTLLRLHTFAVFGAGDGDKVEICRGSKWAVYRDLLGKLLCNWKLVHMPRCPQQFLSRCPTFKFLDFKLLLDIAKARKLFGKVESPYILWNFELGRCSECQAVEHVTLFSNEM